METILAIFAALVALFDGPGAVLLVGATAFGFVGLEGIFERRLDQIDRGIQIVRDAIAKTVAFHNQQANLFTAKLAADVIIARELFEMPGGGRLQPLDEHGVPLPTQALARYPVAYPIRGGGDAIGMDRITRALMTVGEANASAQDARIKDKNFLIDHMLAAVLTATSYTYHDANKRGYTGVGDVTVQPLANGDSTAYLVNRGRGTVTEHNHYLAQAGDISSGANPFRTIKRHLTEHTDDLDSTVDVYVAEDLVADIELLPSFREPRDVTITYGSGESTVAKGDKGLGDEYVGYVDGCHIVNMGRLPSGYMLAHLRGAQPLGRRQWPAPSVQGLFTEEHSPDGAHFEIRYLRYAGFGVRNRTAALAYQVGAGSYATPAAYAAPLVN